MGEDWGKLIVAKGIKMLHKVQNIAQSGHTADNLSKNDIFKRWAIHGLLVLYFRLL